MNTAPSSSNLRRITVLFALSMGALASVARATAPDDESINNPAQKSNLAAPARGEVGRNPADRESPIALSSARLASALRGSDVHNAQGEKIGAVSDVVVDLNSGRTPYLVIESGSVLGMGGRERAVPSGALQPSVTPGKRGGFLLDVSNELWEQVPLFDRARLADLENEIHGRNLHQVYGQTWLADSPVADSGQANSPGVNPSDRGRKETGGNLDEKNSETEAMARGAQLVFASDLRGEALFITPNGGEAGSINDVVLAHEGTRAAILLDPTPALTRDGRKFVIPFDRVIREGSGRYATDLSTDEFTAAGATPETDRASDAFRAVRQWPTHEERGRGDH